MDDKYRLKEIEKPEGKHWTISLGKRPKGIHLWHVREKRWYRNSGNRELVEQWVVLGKYISRFSALKKVEEYRKSKAPAPVIFVDTNLGKKEML